MNVKVEQSMVQQCYDYLNNEIKALESQREQAINSRTAVGHQLAKMIDGQIRKKQEELEHIRYALYNMT